MDERRNRRPLLATVIFSLATLLLRIDPVSQAADQYSEDALKAAYLYRFPGYIEWPNKRADAGGTIEIAILGAAGVAQELEQMLQKQPADAQKVRIRRIDSIAQVDNAHVLFVGSERSPLALRRIIAPLESRPILIVTDDARGLTTGSAINFTQADRRIRFEVSLPHAKRSGLRISSELLSVAVRVEVDQGASALFER